MARYTVTIATAWSPEQVFAYMADARNFAVWDPSVRSSVIAEGDAPGAGTAFDVAVDGPMGRAVTLRYTTSTYEPPSRVVLDAQNSMLRSHDVITVAAGTEGGASMTYDAVLALKGPLGIFDSLLGRQFRTTADKAVAGLRRVLEGPAPA